MPLAVGDEPDLSDLFADYKACLVVRNVVDGAEFRWGGDECLRVTIPCSTFKIPHTLIALETRAVRPDQRFHWDGSPQVFPAWAADHDLYSANRYSVVWVFQRIAKRIGEERMRKWLRRLGYGNRDISSGLDRFWLSGGSLKINPVDQVTFLARLMRHDLDASKVSQIRTLGRIPKVDELRGKTGTGITGDQTTLGWFVGMHYDTGEYSEAEEDWQWRAYAYALRIEGPGASGRNAMKLAAAALPRTGVIPGGARFTFPPEPDEPPDALEIHAGDEGLDLSSLAGRTDLRRLELVGWEGADLSVVGALRSLEELKVQGSGFGRLTDLAWIAGLAGLKELSIENTRTKDIRALAPFVHLRSLSLWSQPTEDITPLKGMKDLESLILLWTAVKDVSPIAGLTKLRKLTLPCAAEGLEILRDLPDLEDLSLCREEALDPAPVTGKRHLYKLRLKSRGPIDLAPLASLPMLEELVLMDGVLVNAEALLEVPRLRKLKLLRIKLDRELVHRLRAAKPDLDIDED